MDKKLQSRQIKKLMKSFKKHGGGAKAKKISCKTSEELKKSLQASFERKFPEFFKDKKES